MIRGSCLCGAVTVEIDEPLEHRRARERVRPRLRMKPIPAYPTGDGPQGISD